MIVSLIQHIKLSQRKVPNIINSNEKYFISINIIPNRYSE